MSEGVLMIGSKQISTRQIRFRCPRAICTRLFIITRSFSATTARRGSSLWLRDSQVIGLSVGDWPSDYLIILYTNKNSECRYSELFVCHAACRFLCSFFGNPVCSILAYKHIFFNVTLLVLRNIIASNKWQF